MTNPSQSTQSQSTQSTSHAMLEKFLTPEAILTPGGAGLLVMTMASAVSTLARDVNFLHLMVGLSFLIGLLVFIPAGKLWHKLIYYVLNSLIIYCMALGGYANVTGKTLYPSREQVATQSGPPDVTISTRALPMDGNPIKEEQKK